MRREFEKKYYELNPEPHKPRSIIAPLFSSTCMGLANIQFHWQYKRPGKSSRACADIDDVPKKWRSQAKYIPINTMIGRPQPIDGDKSNGYSVRLHTDSQYPNGNNNGLPYIVVTIPHSANLSAQEALNIAKRTLLYI